MNAAPVRTITAGDLNASLSEGWSDFISKRGDLIFAGAIYPAIGFVAAVAASGYSIIPLLFPMLAGLSLLGPIAATGFYELARRRELGIDSRWWHMFDIRKSEQIEEIGAVGALLLGIFVVWIVAAALLHAAFLGDTAPASMTEFVTETFMTPQGWAMIAVGNLVGLAFAVLVLAVSAVSLPMLVDRKVSAGTAIRTSLAAFNANRGVMLRWGLIVAALLVAGSVPLLLGLPVVLPVLGYATWHLYTKVVDRGGLPPA